MENYIKLNNQKIELTDEQVREIQKSFGISNIVYDKENGTAKIGKYEFIILEDYGGQVMVLLTDTLCDSQGFGKNNNYNGSYVDEICNKFADEIGSIIGKENLIEFNVDLTSDDGLKDYGVIKRKAALLTAEQCRKYVDILDKFKLDKYWWLVTAQSTPTHTQYNWVRCVSPDGFINYGNYYVNLGVRPFLIFKSNIFESRND